MSLDTNSQTLKIKGVAYDISNKEVSEDAIQKLAYRFKAYLVLDSDNKLRQAKSIRAVMDYAKEQLDDKNVQYATTFYRKCLSDNRRTGCFNQRQLL